MAQGDFNGRGIWTFEQDGEWVNITYDWKMTADKPLLKTFSPIMKPIFGWNHQWAMAKGLESLELELAQRRSPRHAPSPATTNNNLTGSNDVGNGRTRSAWHMAHFHIEKY